VAQKAMTVPRFFGVVHSAMARVVPGHPLDCPSPLMQNSTPNSTAVRTMPNAAQHPDESSIP
jgi:hypothetical protein